MRAFSGTGAVHVQTNSTSSASARANGVSAPGSTTGSASPAGASRLGLTPVLQIQPAGTTWTQTLPGAASVYGVAINMEGDLATAVGNLGAAGVLGLLVIGETGGVWAWTTSTEHNPNSTSMSGDGGLITVADGHPDGTPGAFYLYSAGTTTPIWVASLFRPRLPWTISSPSA